MHKVELVKIEQIQTVPLEELPQKKHRNRNSYLITVVLLFLFLASSISTLTGYLLYQSYHSDLALAQTGMRHLRSGMTLLGSLQKQGYSPQIVERAQHEFTGALSDTQALQKGLATYSGVANLTPVYGPRLTAAIHLSALAVDASKAGIGGSKILGMLLTHVSSPLKASASGLSSVDYTNLTQQFQQVKNAINGAISEATLLKPSDVTFFDAYLAKQLQEFQAYIPTIHIALSAADQLLPALPTLLGIGTPANYLLEILDSTELRPAGGFIGNYGKATLSGGRLTSAHITDVDLLDGPFRSSGHTIPYPSTYSWFTHYLAPTSWSLRDSNLDANFPTAARYGESNFEREGGNAPLQGVIAITPFFIEHVMDITGPIKVPEYHETVTAQNLISLIHFHQLGGRAAGEGSDQIPSPDGHSSLRKRFTELLEEHLMADVQQLPPGSMAQILRLMVNSLHSKDIQVYFNTASAENVLHLMHLDDTIQSPAGDHLFIVDANVGGDKANSFIVNTVQDHVAIDVHGDAIHHTAITYSWSLAGRNYGKSEYKDYLRIYVPPDSALTAQSGWQALGTDTAFGSRVWTGFFTLVYGQERTITLLWQSNGAARQNGSGWQYQYLLQRQAGIQRMLNLQVALPSCASVTRRWGGLLSQSAQVEGLKQSFIQDLNTGVGYACK